MQSDAPADGPAGDLVTANRVLYEQGVVDAFGHVSVRHGGDPERFLLARSMAPGLVTSADVMTFALDGTLAGEDDRAQHVERFIHGSIYRARPDVAAIVHSHAPALLPFGLVPGVPLLPVWHMSAFLGAGVPVFEVRDAYGPDNDMLVRDERGGAALAGSLGSHAAVLMRGHGATVVAATLKEAVFRAVYLMLNAQVQIDAMHLGAPTPLNEHEAARAAATGPSQAERAWSLWTTEHDAAPSRGTARGFARNSAGTTTARPAMP